MTDLERHLIEVEGDGERIDRYLGERLPLSRSRVVALITDGQVRVNGALPRKSAILSAGDTIEVLVPPARASTVEAEDIPLHIVYEDDDLVVVDKPAGLVVHPAPGHGTGTLVNALLYHIGDLSGIGGVRRPGIVHRLDKDTSGLMLVAKHDQAHRTLADALKRREVRRRYLAACWGHVDEDRFSVDAPVGRSRRDRKKMAVTQEGRRALTHIRRLERWASADLLSVRLETGRTHQIRVHLLHVGHPVVGDPIYASGWERGISGRGAGWAKGLAKRTPRLFLHATELRLAHPRTGEPLRFRAQLPEDLASVRAWARGESASD